MSEGRNTNAQGRRFLMNNKTVQMPSPMTSLSQQFERKASLSNRADFESSLSMGIEDESMASLMSATPRSEDEGSMFRFDSADIDNSYRGKFNFSDSFDDDNDDDIDNAGRAMYRSVDMGSKFETHQLDQLDMDQENAAENSMVSFTNQSTPIQKFNLQVESSPFDNHSTAAAKFNTSNASLDLSLDLSSDDVNASSISSASAGSAGSSVNNDHDQLLEQIGSPTEYKQGKGRQPRKKRRRCKSVQPMTSPESGGSASSSTQNDSNSLNGSFRALDDSESSVWSVVNDSAVGKPLARMPSRSPNFDDGNFTSLVDGDFDDQDNNDYPANHTYHDDQEDDDELAQFEQSLTRSSKNRSVSRNLMDGMQQDDLFDSDQYNNHEHDNNLFTISRPAKRKNPSFLKDDRYDSASESEGESDVSGWHQRRMNSSTVPRQSLFGRQHDGQQQNQEDDDEEDSDTDIEPSQDTDVETDVEDEQDQQDEEEDAEAHRFALQRTNSAEKPLPLHIQGHGLRNDNTHMSQDAFSLRERRNSMKSRGSKHMQRAPPLPGKLMRSMTMKSIAGDGDFQHSLCADDDNDSDSDNDNDDFALFKNPPARKSRLMNRLQRSNSTINVMDSHRPRLQRKKSASVDRSMGIDSSDDEQLGSAPKKDKEFVEGPLQGDNVFPTLLNGEHPDLKCISPHTLSDVLQGKYEGKYDQLYIIDCRYPYEYDGGHIQGAINITDIQEVIDQFMMEPKKNTVFIFHCEFSSRRGPKLCRFLRYLDRMANFEVYPELFYRQVYLLDSGYCCFYPKYPELCEPQNYLQMKDQAYSEQLKEWTVINKNMELKRLWYMQAENLTEFQQYHRERRNGGGAGNNNGGVPPMLLETQSCDMESSSHDDDQDMFQSNMHNDNSMSSSGPVVLTGAMRPPDLSDMKMLQRQRKRNQRKQSGQRLRQRRSKSRLSFCEENGLNQDDQEEEDVELELENCNRNRNRSKVTRRFDRSQSIADFGTKRPGMALSFDEGDLEESD